MTKLSLNFVYLAFLALPGIVGARTYRRLTRKASSKNWEDLVEILVFALVSYLACHMLFALLNFCFGWDLQLRALETLSNIGEEKQEQKHVFYWAEIVSSCVIGLFLGFGAAFLNNWQFITKLGRILRVTKSYGDEDVWDYFLNSDQIPSWCYVKDHKLGILYFGEIVVFSDSGKERELILEDVKAFDIDSGEELFSRDVVYLSRERFDLTIEIPKLDLGASVETAAQDGEERKDAEQE